MCRSRRELSNAYLIAKIGVDTAENEPLEVWGENSIQYALHSLLETAALARHGSRRGDRREAPLDLAVEGARGARASLFVRGGGRDRGGLVKFFSALKFQQTSSCKEFAKFVKTSAPAFVFRGASRAARRPRG